jgi:hypothetical protein
VEDAFQNEYDGGFDVVIGNPPYVQLQKMKEASEQLKKLKYKTYESTGDLYCLFYEKGVYILKNNGLLGYITSNKWMRANYGKSMRGFFITYTNPYYFIDLGSGVFESAVVDSNIILLSKEKVINLNIRALNLMNATNVTDFSEYEKNFIDIQPNEKEIWVIENKNESRITSKINKIGTKLKDWDVIINYGIKTGYNDAFIIDNQARQRIISEDTKSADLIIPILRGRDIKRYIPDYANLWLIGTFPSLQIDINNYVGIKNFLHNFGKKLNQTGELFFDEEGHQQRSRKKTNNRWFETQDTISYYKSFNGPKILYPNMTKFLPFIYDENMNYHINDKAFMITGKSLKFLTVYLNSNLAKYQIRKECAELQGGTRELRKVYMEQIHIPYISENKEIAFNGFCDFMLKNYNSFKSITNDFTKYLQSQFSIEKLSKKLQNWHELDFAEFIKELNKANKKTGGDKLSKMDEMEWMDVFETKKAEAQAIKAEIDKTDKEIDQMVYELYGLTDEEIKIVEGGV